MQVTEVQIAFVKPHNGLFAFANVVLEDQLYLGSIAIHRKLDGSGYRLTYPTRKRGEQPAHLFHPIRKPLSLALKQAIFSKLKDVMSKTDAGHDHADAAPAGF